MLPDNPPVAPPAGQAPDTNFLVHGDKTYYLTPPDQRVAMESIKQEIIRLRGSAVSGLIRNQQLLADASPELQRLFVQEALRSDASRHVSAREMSEWVASLDGQAFMLLLSIRPRHPEVTIEIAMEIAAEEVSRAARKAALEQKIAERDRQNGQSGDGQPAAPREPAGPPARVELTEADFEEAMRATP